jgi:hypothetical protein
MFNMAKLALAGALVLGTSAVQAGNDNKNPQDKGGYRVGPLGQHFSGANPAFHHSMRRGNEAYAFTPGYSRFSPHRSRSWGWDWDRY